MSFSVSFPRPSAPCLNSLRIVGYSDATDNMWKLKEKESADLLIGIQRGLSLIITDQFLDGCCLYCISDKLTANQT